jgi:hypothetical protein
VFPRRRSRLPVTEGGPFHLAYPQAGDKFIVDNNVRIGVLSQVQDGKERVIVFYSKTLNKLERSYCATRRELLAIVRTLEHFSK